MSAVRPIEAEYISPAEAALARAVDGGYESASFELRLQVYVDNGTILDLKCYELETLILSFN